MNGPRSSEDAARQGRDRARDSFRAFAEGEVAPHADRIDREARIEPALVQRLAAKGCLGLGLPAEFGGGGADAVSYGLLHHELGRISASVEGIVNVHHMAAAPIRRWGAPALRDHWLPRMASGERVGAFAITEPQCGSDAAAIATVAREDGRELVIDGVKKWITAGQIADVFLLLARCRGVPTAVLVERGASGLRIEPIGGMLGCRGYMLAELHLDECRVPRENLVGRIGVGLSHVASVGLDVGRFGLAWGCAGMLRACLEASCARSGDREQFGTSIRSHALVQRMLTRMIADAESVRLLCLEAARLRDLRHPRAIPQTSLAKYAAATALARVAADAVQIHGASGCSSEQSVSRYLRDAKIMELIEGSTQIQEIAIASSCQAWVP